MKRVSDQSNDAAHGLAKCHPKIWEGFRDGVNRLRREHAEYVAALPNDAKGAVAVALDQLAPDHESLPRNFERAQHLAQALEIILAEGDVVRTEASALEAAHWIADQITQDLRDVRQALDVCVDALTNVSLPGNKRFSEAVQVA